MSKSLFIQILLIVYVIFSTIVLIKGNSSLFNMHSLSFITHNSAQDERLHIAIVSDLDTKTVILTRIFHNKLFFTINTFFNSIARATDLSFLYSFSNGSSMYGEEQHMSMLPIFEFPFFIIASFILIKNWGRFSKRYYFLLLALLIALLLQGLFLPSIQFVKLLPLIITLRLITAFGLFELFNNIWLKK